MNNQPGFSTPGLLTYVWGFMKYLVYSTPVVGELDWIGRIVEAVAATIQERNKFGLVR